MNILLWALQVLLAAHTAIGAVWKFFNPAQTMPSLSAIPRGVWLGMSVIELLCAAGLVVPFFYEPLAFLIPLAAILIAAEMLLFCWVHAASGDASYGPPIYWLVVAAVCVLVAYGRVTLNPLVNA